MDDPVDRLRYYVTDTLSLLATVPEAAVAARFMTSQRWRLHQLFPDDLADADRPFIDLLRREIDAATTAGLVASTSPERDALLIGRLVMASFHHDLYATSEPGNGSVEDVWAFCIAALTGHSER
jgi:hypothetical protein